MKAQIDVCIATYKRPELLRRLLRSLAGQETGEEFSFAVVVADNDAEHSAEGVAREFKDAGGKITYAVEPEQSISLARNKSLSLATAEYIATIDDDTYADRRWLLSLYRAITSYNADVVNGPAVREFPPKTPDYISECPIFNRPNPPTGSTEKYICATVNSLFRRKLIEGVAAPFDPRFGRSGGEDTVFFYQLKKRGCRMIWCREALVFDPVPSSRANLAWVLKRSFCYGNMHHRYYSNFGAIRGAQSRSSHIIIGRLGRAVFYLAGVAVNPKYYGMKFLLRAAYHFGILAYHANFRYDEYGAK
ncbi:MAG TPA: glycosyltransferase family 2 protein [Candidatus Binatia bacterium]